MLQPLLVTLSAIKQASECVRQILKIDDIVSLSVFIEALRLPNIELKMFHIAPSSM